MIFRGFARPLFFSFVISLSLSVQCLALMGYIDKTGKLVIEPKFDRAASFSDGCAWVKAGELWGLIDTSGEYILKPKYHLRESDGGELITEFSEGLCEVELSSGSFGTKMGYIDTSGQVVIEPQFSNAYPFSNGLASVMFFSEKDKVALINKQGKVVKQFDEKVSFVGDFCEGFATYEIRVARTKENPRPKRRIGFINKNFRVVIEPQFEWAHGFSEGLAAVVIDGKTGFIDTKGEVVIPPKFMRAYNFSDGLAPIHKRIKPPYDNHKSGFIDKKGNVVIPAIYNKVTYFVDGIACVYSSGDGESGYINKKGEFLIKGNGEPFSEGLAAFESDNGKWGFIDKSGEFIIEPQFEWAESFSAGLAAVWVE